MTGVAMVKSGMSTVEALLMALIVFAGSSQLAAIPLIMAGAPMWVILVTAFCVNLRFVVFSAHMRPYLMHLPRWQRLVTGYLSADLTYVLFVQHFPKPATDDAGRAGPNGLSGGQRRHQLVELDGVQRGGRGAGQRHSHANGAWALPAFWLCWA